MAQSLQFGLDTFGDVTFEPDGRPSSHAQVIRNITNEAILADERGFDFFGIGEHHRADFAVSSPDIVLAAIAGKTSRIHLGSATTILSSDDPVRVFQRLSTLHAATSGRAEIILGRGWFMESFKIFGYDMADYDLIFEEKLELFAKLLRERMVNWQGKTRSPLANQAVFPPLDPQPPKSWVAVGTTPESAIRAARHGFSMMLAVIGGNPERVRPLIDIYRLAFEKLQRPLQQIGLHSPGYVCDTDAQACEEFWTYYKPMRDRIGSERGWPPLQRAQFDVEVRRGALYVGSPETLAKKIASTAQTLPISRFNLKYSVGAMPHARLMQTVWKVVLKGFRRSG